MEENPYAAPSAAADAPPLPSSGATGPQPWEIGEVLQKAFDIFKVQWAVLLGTLVVGYVAIFAVSLIGNLIAGVIGASMAGSDGPGVIGIVIGTLISLAVQLPVSLFVQIGWGRIWIAAARGQSPVFGDLFSGADRIVPGLLGGLIAGAVVLAGMLLLIVPGIIAALGMALVQFLIADTDLQPMELAKKSWELMDGNKMKMFLFALVMMVLAILAAIPCGLGLLVLIPTAGVAFGIVYVRISGRTQAA